SNAEGGELPRLELSGDEAREVTVPRSQALADPARIGAERSDRSNRAPSGLVRVAMSDFAEETTEAGVAERPLSRLCKIDRTGRGKDLIPASARGRGAKGSCEQEQPRDQVREHDEGHQDVHPIAFLAGGEEAEEAGDARGEGE